MDTFSGEICRWTDETDDVSQIPERHADQAERIELQQETLKEVEKTGQPEEGTDRVKNYLENVEKKIEIRRNMEKKISESEKELTLSEESLKRIEEYGAPWEKLCLHAEVPAPSKQLRTCRRYSTQA